MKQGKEREKISQQVDDRWGMNVVDKRKCERRMKGRKI